MIKWYLEQIGVIIGILAPFVVAIVWLARLHWKVSQAEDNIRDLREVLLDYDRRLRDAEAQIKAYSIIDSILDKLEDKKK
ncbi:MAG: hypothetical protein ACPKPY_09570 [Nitrososphaeraceae archaeon]